MRSHSPRSARVNKRAFSLIELLVVMSIIAVLLAILLPALPRVMDAGRRSACSANLRGVGQAIELYKGDFKEIMPVGTYMPRPWLNFQNADGSWPTSLNQAINQYFELDSKAWECPGDKSVYRVTYTDDTGREQLGKSSYMYISALGGQRIEESFFYTRLNLQPVRIPVANDFDGNTYETQDGRMIPVDFFHDTRNLLFGDGHVGKYDQDGPTQPGS